MSRPHSRESYSSYGDSSSSRFDAEDMSHITDDASFSGNPDFATVHNKYTRGLLRGRHPRSFPRQSELWHHYKASNKRLERVSKGHKLWNVMAETEDELHGDSVKSAGEGKRGVKSRLTSRFNDMNSSYIPKEPLHGLHVDMKGSFRMHYGMNIVLMNSLDEVLCVNQHHEVMCKSEDQLEYGDEICFRIVDLVEPTNPGPIAYGAPIWLQALNSEGDNNIYYGFVVGAKLYGPPQMESSQLAENTRKAAAASVPTPNSKESGKEKTSASEGSAVFLTGAGAGARTSDEEGDRKGEGGGGTLSGVEDSPGTQAVPQKKKGPKSSDLSEICGALCTLQAYNGSKDEKTTGMHHLQQKQQAQQSSQQGDDQTRFRSRQASHLANWTVQSALKSGPPEKYVSSIDPIYLEQDLYCLATTHGNTYQPWPRTVEVNRVPAGSSRKQIIKAQQEIQSVKKNTLNESLSGMMAGDIGPGSPSSKDRPGTGDTTQTQQTDLGLNQTAQQALTTFTYNLPHACVRRVVKRGAPYEHLVDRRCVWKFCVVDNPRDLMSMSVKEQRAQQLLRKARDGLNASKRNRLGGRVHNGFELPDGEPLTGGEKFPTLLRSIVSTTALRLETEDMGSRRQKEEDIANHIRDMFKGCNIDNIESIANGSVSLNSLAKSKRKERTIERARAAVASDAADQSALLASQSKTKDLLRKKSNQLVARSKDIEKGPRSKKDFSAGLEILKIHQSFAVVSNKVTTSLIGKSNYMNAVTGGGSSPDKSTCSGAESTHSNVADIISSSSSLSSSGQSLLASSTGGGSGSGHVSGGLESMSRSSSLNLMSSNIMKRQGSGSGASGLGINPQTAAARLEKKLSLMSKEDDRVLLALRHREQLDKRNDMGSLFNQLTDGN